jgi:hypothetical protein
VRRAEGVAERPHSRWSPTHFRRPFPGVHVPTPEPPDRVEFELEEALDLLAALEDSRDILINTDHLSVLSQVEYQIQHLSRKLGIDEGGTNVN